MGAANIPKTEEDKRNTASTSTDRGEEKNTFRLFGVDIEKPPLERKRKDNSQQDDREPEPLPPRIMQEINVGRGTGLKFMFRKKLETSDVNPSNNRLFIPKTKIEKLMEYMTWEERMRFESRGVEVIAIDPKGECHKLLLAIWPSLKVHVLKKEWTKMVVGNNVKDDKCVQLWGFRSNYQLCLAVNFTKKDEETQCSVNK